MKNILASTALALLISGPAFAEAHMGGFVDAAAQSDIYGSDLIGMRLYVAENEIDASAPVTADTRTDWNDVGEVNDLLISEDGQVRAVLLDIGGFLGMGEKTIAVDMANLKFLHDNDDPNDVFIAMQGTQDMLEGAPTFERADMAMNDTATVDTTTAPADTATVDTTATDTAATDPATPMADPNATMWERPATERAGYVPVDVAELTAEKLTGANVYGVNDDVVGDVEDLVLSEDGQIKEAILDIGGFLGIGEHRIAVSFDEMQIVRSEDGSDTRVYISASKEQLEARPGYED